MSRFGWSRVDRQTLRAAILEGDAVVPLIGANAPLAAELVRRAAIDPEARGRAWMLGDPGLGITDAPHWSAPLPERGPFLALLINAPDVGVECILALVDHATQCWADIAAPPLGGSPSMQRHDADAFEVLIDGEPVALTGNSDVMHWHRGDARVPTVLASALMALEAWLYRRLDAGEDIAATLAGLKESTSLAVWGVLGEIACYRPMLLREALSPLVSGAALLLADRLYSLHDHAYLLMPMLGEPVMAQRIQSWNTMPHRKITLFDLIMGDVLSGDALAHELEAARARWQDLDAERWKHLIAQADPANYRVVRSDDGLVGSQYVAPTELVEDMAESTRDAADSDLWLMLPYRIREWIDNRTRPPDEELEEFWITTQERLANPVSDSFFSDRVRSRADLECGVAALFVTCARDWLLAHPERDAWCRGALLSPFEDPPPPHDFDFPGAAVTESWDVFCADALPVLWAETPSDVELRSAVGRLAVMSHYATVSATFRHAAERVELADELQRLEHLSLYWARFVSWLAERRHREESAQHGFGQSPSPDDMPDLPTPTRAAVDDFTRGTLEVETPRLADWVASTPDGMIGAAMGPRHRSLSLVNLGYLTAARRHLVDPLPAPDSDRRRHAIEFGADLATLIAGGLVTDGHERVEGTPYEEDRSVLGLLAELTVQATLEEAKGIWQPILAAGGPAHHWVEDYLRNVWRAARAADRWPTTFPDLVKEMLVFASGADTWRGQYGDSDIDLAIVGLDRWGYSGMQERHGELMSELQPEWAEWIRPRLIGSWFAQHVAQFLGQSAAVLLRRDGLEWLAERERSPAVGDSGLDEAVAELLLRVWLVEPVLLRGADNAASDARYLLSRLAGRGVPLAVELSARLA